jgi:hypothetical protein
MPEGGQIDGHQVRWIWKNLDPDPQDDFFIQLLLLDRWDELQATRAAVTANPRDGEAWLKLASIYCTLTRGTAYSAARMLPGFGEIYQPLGVQAAHEALRLLPGDGRPHYELALLYASALPENASREDLKPVMEELQIVEDLEPALAPNIHDAMDFLGVFWAVETARAEATLMAEPSAITAPTLKASLTFTPVPSATPQPPPVATAPVVTTDVGQGKILSLIIIVVVLMSVGYLVLHRKRRSSS